MTGVAGLVVALGLASGAAAAVPAANGGNSDEARAEHQRIVDFWTKDKVAQAKPRDFVRDRATGEFTLAEIATASVLGTSWLDGGEVQETTGKVLFAMGTSYYVCSASVVADTKADRSIILTAGHCVYDNATARFATNWMFVPDYDSTPTVDLTTNGSFCAATEYGCWTASALVVHRGFASQRIFNAQATVYDFAFAVVGVGGKSTNPNPQLDGTVGSQEITYSPVGYGTDTFLFGYPAAGDYTGKELIYSVGPLGTDPLNKDLTYRVASNMTGGSSGGPWFTSPSNAPFTDGSGTMISVNSYGYTGIKAMHGPKFNINTNKLFDTANAAKAPVKNTVVR